MDYPEFVKDDGTKIKLDYNQTAVMLQIANRLAALEEVTREAAAARKAEEVKPLKVKEKGKPRDRSTSTESDSESSDSGDASSTSAYSSGRRVRRSRRDGHRRHKRRQSKSSVLKASRYSHHRHLAKGETVKTFEKLMCVSLRVMKDLLQRGEDVTGLVSHMTVLADKADTRFYKAENLVAYDKAVRSAAAQEGASKLGVVDSTLVMQHLGFDAATTNRRPVATHTVSAKPKRSGYCYRFNGGAQCDSTRCPFQHVCGNCGDASHTQPLCKRPKQGQVTTTGTSSK